MSKKSLPIYSALALNGAKVCAVSGCSTVRHKLCRVCRKHDERRRRWGTPLGRCWRAGDIGTYADVAEDFIVANADHAGIVSAIEWLDAEIADAAEKSGKPPTTSATKVFGAFHAHGVDGQALLIRCVAATIYLTELPEIEQEQEPYIRNMGLYCLRAVVPAIARGQRQHAYARDLGNYLYTNLKDLLVNIIVHKRRYERARQDFKEAASQPFAGA